MKRNIIFSSLLGLGFLATLLFQNCNKQQFGEDYYESVSGKVEAMDETGFISGSLDMGTCETWQYGCPENVTVRFYAVDKATKRELYIGEAPGQVDDEDDAIYYFNYTIEETYKCKTILAYVEDPNTFNVVKLSFVHDVKMWGEDGSCSGPDFSYIPEIDIQSVKRDGRLVELAGACVSGTNVEFTGDLTSSSNKTEACTSGAFKHCDLLSKQGMSNFIVAKQTVSAVTGQDAETVILNSVPAAILSFETFVRTGTKNLAITGRCFPNSSIVLSLSSTAFATVTCDLSGYFSYNGSPLTTSTTNVIKAVQTTSAGVQTSTSYIVENSSTTPTCSITATPARTGYCVKEAGSIQGTCTPHIPVIVTVNGREQSYGSCSSTGFFDIPNVLLDKVGVASEIKITQKTPYGKTCTATKSMTTF